MRGALGGGGGWGVSVLRVKAAEGRLQVNATDTFRHDVKEETRS